MSCDVKRVGIIGCGFVGGALKRWFEEHTTHVVKAYDPEKGFIDQETFRQDFVFVCVPVPTKKDSTQDKEILFEVYNSIKWGSNVFIRSTVLPDTSDSLGYLSGNKVHAMPEFLTARNAYDDMCSLPVVVGNADGLDMESLFPGKKIYRVSNVEAEIIKYAHNCFLASKVNFFNFIHELCQGYPRNADYKKIIEAIQLTGFIIPTHTNVPGPDGKRGFGGTCFPKDLYAFNEYLRQIGMPSKMLEGVELDNYRNRMKWEF